MVSRIAFFLYWLNGGGIPRVMVNLANGIVKKGYKVDFILGKAKGSYLKYLSNKIEVIDLNSRRGVTCIPGLTKYLKKNKPDIFFTGDTRLNIVAILAYLFSNISKTKIVISEHADFYENQRNRKFPINIIIYSLSKLLYKKVNKIVAVSRGVCDSIKIAYNLDESDIITIYNPVINNDLYKKSKEILNHPWINKDYSIIISVGRLIKQKNFPFLLKVFSNVKKRINAKLIILGEGKDRKYLEKIVKDLDLIDEVDMPGFVSNPYKYLKNANLFILSSLWEGFGNVLVEALACGTKVISTNCPYGPKEIIDIAGTGRLIPINDEKELEKAIMEELKNDFKKPKLDSFKISYVVDKYLELFNKLD